MCKNVKLMKGDCLELMKEIPDGSVDLIVTDPPYGIMAGGGANKAGYVRRHELGRAGAND